MLTVFIRTHKFLQSKISRSFNFILILGFKVREGRNTFSVISLNIGSPQGCVLSPLFFTLMTHNCIVGSVINHSIKNADNTTVVGLNSNNKELAHWEEVAQLVNWC